MATGELAQLQEKLLREPYSLVVHLQLSQKLKDLGYPDLAAGYAYKSLLLVDEILEESGEYHSEALEAARASLVFPGDKIAEPTADSGPLHGQLKCVEGFPDDVVTSIASSSWREIAYRVLVHSLINCGCLRSAKDLCSKGLQTLKNVPNVNLARLEDAARLITQEAQRHFKAKDQTNDIDSISLIGWPEQGSVRREVYVWNAYEPDRLSEASLKVMNSEMHKVAPKLEVRITDLPTLSLDQSKLDQIGLGPNSSIKQLGVFASQDLSPGEIVLDETSVLTSNNRLNDTLCDACSSDLPNLDSNLTTTVSCAECGVAIFCSQKCHDLAQATYHPALCDRDIEAIAKDVPPAEAADALYTLLLLRTFAMAETQDVHPLDLKEVKYIWGDFTPNAARPSNAPTAAAASVPDTAGDEDDAFCGRPRPRTLPWTFSANVLLPLHMLEKMGVDIFAAAPRYDGWVFNTLYAKFRGTASARLTGRGGGGVARGPEVGAVHPLWCLANHSCDPNVEWEWGGSIKFTVRGERKRWRRERREGEEEGKKEEELEDGDDGRREVGKWEERKPVEAGIGKDEEVLGHYCDIDLSVKDRREWAAGALGGHCLCERCRWESREID